VGPRAYKKVLPKGKIIDLIHRVNFNDILILILSLEKQINLELSESNLQISP